MIKYFSYLFKKSVKDKVILFNLVANLILNILIWLVLIWRIRPQEMPIFLHYNIYFGIDLMGEWYKVFLIPLSGLVIILLNFFFSIIIYNKGKLISYFLAISATLMQIILLISAILVILLNIV